MIPPREGVAFRLGSLLREARFEISVSVPLVLEYEEVLHRTTDLGEEEILAVVRYLCSVAYRQAIFFFWRPSLPDPKDDKVLELAVASRARYVVTFNEKHFAAAGPFGIQVVTQSVPRYHRSLIMATLSRRLRTRFLGSHQGSSFVP